MNVEQIINLSFLENSRSFGVEFWNSEMSFQNDENQSEGCVCYYMVLEPDSLGSLTVIMSQLVLYCMKRPCERCCWISWGSARRLFRHFVAFPFFLRRRQVLPWEERPKLLPHRVTALFLSFFSFFLNFHRSLCLDSNSTTMQHNSIIFFWILILTEKCVGYILVPSFI